MIYALVTEGLTSEEQAEMDDLLAGTQQQTARRERIGQARELQAVRGGSR